MKSTPYAVVLLLCIAYTGNSCNKIEEYFREPETDVLVETLHSTTLTGYAASIAMSVMKGQTYPQVVTIRNGEGFPCTTLMEVDLHQTSFAYTSDKAGAVTIAGLWPDANTAILSLIYTDYQVGTNILDIVGIETIPVLRDGNDIHVVLASQDIQLNPEQQSLLSIDLNTFQIESELFRLDMPRPNDVYVALVQNAYFIDINNNGTMADLDDDRYTVTGGGQLVEIDGNDAEIIQQAMVDVRVSPTCQLNPLNGMALIKVTGLEDRGFPELGTAVIEFSDRCEGSAHVFAATGMYIGSNGSKVSFLL